MALPPDDPILNEALARAGLAHRVGEIAPLAEYEIELASVTHETESYFGGEPRLPPDVAWPVYRYRRDEIATWPDYARAEVEQARARGHLVDEGEHVAVPLRWLGILDFAELLCMSPRLPREGQLALFFSHETHVPDPELAGRRHARAIYIHAPCARRPHPPQPEPLLDGRIQLAPRMTVTWHPDVWNTFSRTWPEADLHALSSAGAREMQTHRLLPSPREELAGPMPPEGHVAFLRVATAPTINMHFGDDAWVTWVLLERDLDAGRFDDMRASVFVG